MDVSTLRKLFELYATEIAPLIPGMDPSRKLQVLEALKRGPVTKKQLQQELKVKHPTELKIVAYLLDAEMIEDSPTRQGRAHHFQLSEHGRTRLAKFETSLDVVCKTPKNSTESFSDNKQLRAEPTRKTSARSGRHNHSSKRLALNQLPLDFSSVPPGTSKGEARKLEAGSPAPVNVGVVNSTAANGSADVGASLIWKAYEKIYPEKIKAWNKRQAALPTRVKR